jgi:hypothetical protein
MSVGAKMIAAHDEIFFTCSFCRFTSVWRRATSAVHRERLVEHGAEPVDALGDADRVILHVPQAPLQLDVDVVDVVALQPLDDPDERVGRAGEPDELAGQLVDAPRERVVVGVAEQASSISSMSFSMPATTGSYSSTIRSSTA